MADNDKSGMGMLRKLVGDLGTSTRGKRVDDAIVKSCVSGEYPSVGFGAFLGEIADRIERERNDIIKRHAVALANAEARVADLERNMTGEAREVVERLREIDPVSLNSGEIAKAVGIDGFGLFGEAKCDELIDRLCDLIEHGGKQDVDVAALRELLRKIDILVKKDSVCQYFGAMGESCDGCPAFDEDCSRAVIADIAERIRKAIEGAPVDLATAAGNLVAQCRPCRERRETAADWVKAHGGLDEVRHHYSFMVDQVAARLGVERGNDDPEHVTIGKIMSELDKRLIPEGMGWPRDTEGCRVDFGDLLADDTDNHDARAVDSIKFVGSRAYLYDRYGCLITTIDAEFDERIVRPKPEVLGADGKPIVEGETVWDADGEKYVVNEIWGDGVDCQHADDRQRYSVIDADGLTHTPPETQERIDDDKHKSTSSYWDCYGRDGSNCPSLINGKTPNKHYGVVGCVVAQGMDIARREQELRARTGGAR